MTERERLTELIMNTPKIPVEINGRAQGRTYQTARNIADHLLANGVIVPPCKVGGIVYEVQELYERVQEYEVVSILYSNSGFSFGWNLKDGKGFYSNNVLGFTERDIGKTIFLTREDAERALAERSKHDTERSV